MNRLNVLRDVIVGGLTSEDIDASEADIICALHLAAREKEDEYLAETVYVVENEEDSEEDNEEKPLPIHEELRGIILGSIQAEVDTGEWEFTNEEIIASLHLAAREFENDYLDENVYNTVDDDAFDDTGDYTAGGGD